jgi:hypothetical protein
MENGYIKELTSILDHKRKAYQECEQELYSGKNSYIVIAALQLYQFELKQEIEKYNKNLLYALQSKDIS